MNIALAFFFLALGIALDAAHNRVLRDSETRAYGSGYRQAQKEEKIRITSAAEKAAEIERARYGGYSPNPPALYSTHGTTTPLKVVKSDSDNREGMVPESFWSELQENGRAVTHIQR